MWLMATCRTSNDRWSQDMKSLGGWRPLAKVTKTSRWERVGVRWLGWTCGECEYCHDSNENLFLNPEFTDYSRDGSYVGYFLADHRYCFPIHGDYSDAEVAPYFAPV